MFVSLLVCARRTHMSWYLEASSASPSSYQNCPTSTHLLLLLLRFSLPLSLSSPSLMSYLTRSLVFVLSLLYKTNTLCVSSSPLQNRNRYPTSPTSR